MVSSDLFGTDAVSALAATVHWLSDCENFGLVVECSWALTRDTTVNGCTDNADDKCTWGGGQWFAIYQLAVGGWRHPVRQLPQTLMIVPGKPFFILYEWKL